MRFSMLSLGLALAVSATAWGQEVAVVIEPLQVGAELDKVDGEILAHQKDKVRPPGMTAQEHRHRLINLGVNPNNLLAEDSPPPGPGPA